MSRRNPPQHSHDPDKEKGLEELDIIEGQKNTLQTEVLGIAQNKKDLESSFEEAKKRLDEEFENKKKILQQEITALEGNLVTLKNQEEIAKHETKHAIEKKEGAIKERDTHVNEARKILEEKNAVINIKISESKIVHDLENKHKILTKEILDLENKHKILTKEILDLENKHKKLFDEVDELADIVTAHNRDLRHLQEKLTDLRTILKDLEKEEGVRKETISQLNAQIVELHKEISQKKEDIQKRENQINERLKNAVNLEVFVDKKRTELKEIESHFVSEHLARVGYKKIS